MHLLISNLKTYRVQSTEYSKPVILLYLVIFWKRQKYSTPVIYVVENEWYFICHHGIASLLNFSYSQKFKYKLSHKAWKCSLWNYYVVKIIISRALPENCLLCAMMYSTRPWARELKQPLYFFWRNGPGIEKANVKFWLAMTGASIAKSTTRVHSSELILKTNHVKFK